MDAAADAYQKSLKLNHDLIVVHYNLGCAYLEQNRADKLDDARNELTAFTLHQPNSAPGFVKLGEVQVRLRDAPGADKSFRQALQLSADNVEAMNGLGIVEWQRNRYRDAAAWFTNALAHKPGFAPALLNLAIVSQSYLNNRPFALQKYHEYLALNPRPADADAVTAVARQLDQELNPVPREPTNSIAAPANVSLAGGRSSSNASTRAGTSVSNGPKTELAANNPRPVAPSPRLAPANETEPPVEVVQIPGTAPQPGGGDSTTTTPATEPVVGNPSGGDANSPDASRPGLFQRINPFRRTPNTVETPAPEPEATPAGVDHSGESSARAPLSPRYSYVLPPKPAEGNLTEAERFFAQAAQAQTDHRPKDAVALYREATQADPAFFEAQANLGLSAYDAGDLTQSLLAYETALAIKPDSFSARFKFGLALGKAGYIQDAAQELERTLAANPGETPAHLSMVHLALANLYAEQFHRPTYARPHYLKVLELDPDNSQGQAIRSWLKVNP